MQKFYTAESVTEGHPDKLCDLIADSILDACLAKDPNARVACEVLATSGYIVVAGEITTLVFPDVFDIVRDTLKEVGYNPADYQIECHLHRQSRDIAEAVEEPLGCEDGELGAGDQGVMVGYATDETAEYLPPAVVIAHRITNLITAAFKSKSIQGIRPDGKAQVTVEYEDDTFVRVDNIIVSVQHSAEKDERQLMLEVGELVSMAVRGFPVDDKMKISVNPSGRFVEGGPEADTGLTGRKLMVDTYGPLVPHGGGAFSGKDPTKVDRSGAYMARYLAKSLVAAHLCERCTVSLAYAIGQPEPVMVAVDTFGTAEKCGSAADDALAAVLLVVFDLTPSGIMQIFQLQRPIYAQTAVGGHFGRGELPWERTDKVALLRESVLE